MSRPLELPALEPEKNRLIFQLNNNSTLKELKKRLLFCSTTPIKNQNLIVTSVSVIKKKKRKEAPKRKRITLFLATIYPRFAYFFYNTNFYSTFPELILLRTLFHIFFVDFFQSPYSFISFEIVSRQLLFNRAICASIFRLRSNCFLYRLCMNLL